MLNIHDLTWGRANKTLFKQLNLSVNAGEHIVIVGDSGGGKSTLLELIADQQNPSIQYEDQATVSMVLQNGALLDHLSVIKNLKLIAEYNSIANPQTRIDECLSQLNISPSLQTASVSQLSGGQMRRVAIARALLLQPEILLFDEPDAGLDIVNLQSLADTVVSLHPNRACLTVSHNPYYIARVATKVVRLTKGKLETMVDWRTAAENEQQAQQRQDWLQQQLQSHSVVVETDHSNKNELRQKPAKEWVIKSWLQGSAKLLSGLFSMPRSLKHELHIAGYSVYLALISGLLFFGLVGLMLGSTIVAVVQMLADNALTGIVSWFVDANQLIEMMGGSYVLYLAPPIGGMLFAARSGSIMSHWLGEMVRGRQLQALDYLNVPITQYISSPAWWGTTLSMFLSIVWFSICVWLGGVITAEALFDIQNATKIMAIDHWQLKFSNYWCKTLVYSLLVGTTVVALGLAPKRSSHQVNMHTTKAIIYATLAVAFTELAIILL